MFCHLFRCSQVDLKWHSFYTDVIVGPKKYRDDVNKRIILGREWYYLSEKHLCLKKHLNYKFIDIWNNIHGKYNYLLALFLCVPCY